MRKVSLSFIFFLVLLMVIGCSNHQVQIYFDTTGGDFLPDIVLNEGEFLESLPTPTRQGYQFDGWYIDDDYAVLFSIKSPIVEKETTLYAKWSRIVENIVISFDSDGGSIIEPMVYPPGVTITSPTTPTKTGNTFSGWYTDLDYTSLYTFSTMPSSNLTLYAKWVVNTYTITFEVNGGSTVEPISDLFGSIVNEPSMPVLSGHIFKGWFTDTSLTTPYLFSTIPETNITLYAKWEASESIMSFDSQGGTAIEPLSEIAGTNIDAPIDPTKEGFIFAGWYESIQAIDPYEFDTMPDANITLYANWASEGLIYELIEDSYYEISAGDACQLESISIPKYHLGKPVQSIANQGFMNCSEVTEINLPETLKKILNGAFMYTSLTSIFIPSSVEFFGLAVFRFTNQLEEIIVDSNSLSFKSQDGVLFSKDGLTLVRYPSAKIDTEYVIDHTVEIIGSDAFSSSHNLTSVLIGNSVHTIQDHAFYNCQGLASIVIPNNVTTVEIYIFRDCVSLATVQLGTGIPMISSYMFDGCVSLTSIIIPYQVLSIAYGAFFDCIRLTSVHLKRSSLDGITTGALFMFANTPLTMKIFVEDQMSMTAYKQATYWSSYQSRIEVKP